jgi:hypothetical protein
MSRRFPHHMAIVVRCALAAKACPDLRRAQARAASGLNSVVLLCLSSLDVVVDELRSNAHNGYDVATLTPPRGGGFR